MTPGALPPCRCSEGRRRHGPRGEPCQKPYSSCIGYEPVTPIPHWPSIPTQRRRTVLTYVRTHLGVQPQRIEHAVCMSRGGVRNLLHFLEDRRLIVHAGPEKKPHYYPRMIGGTPLDARAHYQSYFAPYGPLVRLTRETGPLLLDHLVEAIGWNRFEVSRLLGVAIRQGAMREVPASQPGFLSSYVAIGSTSSH